MEILLGTGEVARLCGVSQATIKRWADNGSLPCVRTMGGHRRFVGRDVRQFLASHDYEVPSELGIGEVGGADPEGVALYALNDEFDRIVDRVVDRALKPGSRGTDAILRTLTTLGVTLERACDRVVMPALQRLAALRELGRITAVDVLAAAEAMEEAVTRLHPRLARAPRSGRHALVAVVATGAPALPARLAATLLDAEGWTVSMARRALPPGAMADYLSRARPDLLCLSFQGLADPDEALDSVVAVGEACREHGVSLVFFGREALRLAPGPEADAVAADLPTLLEASRET
jgi:excisionase family DNA binding protein